MAQSCGSRTGSQAESLNSIASAPACAPRANFQSRLKFSTRRGAESAAKATVAVKKTSKATRRKFRLFILLGVPVLCSFCVRQTGPASLADLPPACPCSRDSRSSPRMVGWLLALSVQCAGHGLATPRASRSALVVRLVRLVRPVGPSPLTPRAIQFLGKPSALNKRLALAFELALQQVGGLVHDTDHRVGG